MSYPDRIVNAPTELAGCLLWFDGQDLSSITKDGSNLVSQWSDKSGNNNHATEGNTANQPTYNATGFGGYPCVDWGAGAVAARRLATPSITLGPHTAFVVLRGDTSSQYIYVHATDSGNGSYLFPTTNHSSQIFRQGTTRSARNVSTTWLRDGKRKQVTISFAGTHGSHIVDVNGFVPITVDSTVGDPGTSTVAGAFYLGNSQAATNALRGVIAEVIVYNRALTDGERAAVERYLAKKWALYPTEHDISAPTDIVDCALWLDASDSASITQSAGTVSQWSDKSGNNKHAVQATPANQPAYSAAGFNGLPCIDWGSSPPSPMGLLTPSISYGAFTAFFVVDGVASHGYLYVHNNAANADFVFSVNAGFSVSRSSVVSSRDASALFGAGAWLVGKKIVTRRFDGVHGSNLARLSGQPVDTTAVSAANPGTVVLSGTVGIGNNVVASFLAWKGKIAEVIFFDRALTDGEMLQVERYLAKKWALYPLRRSIASPLELPNCMLWLDAAQGTTLDGSNNVSQWNDLSGNANHATQASAGLRPAKETSPVAAVTWAVGANNSLVTPSIALDTYTFFYVLMVPTGSTAGYLGYSITDAANLFYFWSSTSKSFQHNRSSLVSSRDVSTTWLRDSTKRVLCVTYGGLHALHDARRGGMQDTYVEGSVANPTGSSAAPIYIGSDNTGAFSARGMKIYELIMFARRLSAGEITLVERYLADKHSLLLFG